MSENGFMDLKQQMIKLFEHLSNENIITGVSANALESQTFEESVILLRYAQRKISKYKIEKNYEKRSLCKRF